MTPSLSNVTIREDANKVDVSDECGSLKFTKSNVYTLQ